MGNHNLPELLAPAGGLSQLRAAVNNGADAVYLGGSRFNARGKAENFTLPKLRDAISYAHERNVKIYVTFNTLLKDRELADALEYAGALWDIGADAVIVQDMGLVRMLRKYLADLPLHLSTQGTVTGKHAVDLMKDFGIRRIVPARELTLEEIREMAEVCHRTEQEKGRGRCELEVFVHGALCMCYSGQCQMSRVLGGGSVRSGNRGLCAQPCRLPYVDDRGREGYFLSPKDLCLLEDIPALCEAGVDSLKIEGRLKSPEYVAVVVRIYRKYLDQYAQTGEIRVSDGDRRDLTQIYNRGGFTKGYLYGNPGQEILSGESPKNTGIYVGKVSSVVAQKKAGKDQAAAAGAARKGAVLVDVSLREPLSEGDGVEFRPGKSRPGRKKHAGARDSHALRGMQAADAAGGVVTFRRELPNGALRIGDMKGNISAGDSVWRVTDRALLQRARESFDTEDPADLNRRMLRHIPLQMRFHAAAGQPAQLEIREKERENEWASGMAGASFAGNSGALEHFAGSPEAAGAAFGGGMGAWGRPAVRVSSRQPMERARNKAAEQERIRQQLGKLGGTPFMASDEDIEVLLDGICAVPIAEINRMRREGIDLLLQEKGQVKRVPADQDLLNQARQDLEQRHLEEPAGPDAVFIPLMEFMEGNADGGRMDPPAGAHGQPFIDAVSKGRLDAYIETHFREIADRLREADTGILIRGNSWIRQFLDAGVKVYGGHGLNIYNEEARLVYEDLGVEVMELSHETGRSPEGRIPLMVTEHLVQSKTLTDRKGCVHRIERSAAGDKTVIW